MSDEFAPHLDAEEATGIDALAERLRGSRPIPPAPMRARIRFRLSEMSESPQRWRPRSPVRLAWIYSGSGIVLMSVAALGLAGVGPLGY